MTPIERLQWLHEKRDNIRAELSMIDREIEALEILRDLADHPCECVRLNRELGIHDIAEQEAAGRIGLSLGLVETTLSARRDCTKCCGTGVPQ